MDIDTELLMGETSSNSSRVYYIHLHENILGKGMNQPVLNQTIIIKLPKYLDLGIKYPIAVDVR